MAKCPKWPPVFCSPFTIFENYEKDFQYPVDFVKKLV